LWINEYGIWPSSEDPGLFDGYRKSLGENKPVHERPGHVFEKSDLEVVASLVGMVLYFVWGALIASPTAGALVVISHDEWLELHLRGDQSLKEPAELIERIARTDG
jgi:hypothetical protein